MSERPFCRPLALPTLAVALVVARAVLAVPPSPNQSGGTTEKAGHGFGWIDPSNGSFTHSIEFDVPEYRGIEPDIGLSYNSAGGNGFVGVGWSLDGASIIERTNIAKGAPAYAANDRWLLDGTPLEPCRGDEAASCRAGGTHYAERETWQRIVHDPGPAPSSSRFYVWDGDGTRYTYEPLFNVPLGQWTPFRYALTRVEDTRGNRVSWVWEYNQFACCWIYPKRIEYPGARIELHWERRPDAEAYANGVGLSTNYGRIKSVVVRAVAEDGTARVQRAYRLLYQVGPLTNRSVLESVTEFGADAVLTPDADGELTVTGGTSLPPISMTYSVSGQYNYGWRAGDAGLGPWCATGSADGSTGEQEYTGDFNGDGKTDLGCRSGALHWIAYSQADSATGRTTFENAGVELSGFCATPSLETLYTADFNGDGMTDLGCNSQGHHWVALSTGTGFGPSQLWVSGWCVYAKSSEKFYQGDFNGDGRTDLGCQSGNNQHVLLSTGAGFTNAGIWRPWWCASEDYQFTGDFNGDGRTDLGCRSATTGGIHVALSDGWHSFTGGGHWIAGWCVSGDGRGIFNEYLFTGDFNGDGKTDLGCQAGGGQYVALSQGNAFFNAGNWDTWGNQFCERGSAGGWAPDPVWGRSNWFYEFPMDFNGDGKTDLGCRRGSWMYVAISDGTKLARLLSHEVYSYCEYATESGTDGTPLMLVADFDGDGRTDTACRTPGGTQRIDLTGYDAPDLLTSIANGRGGKMTVTYASAASWPDTRGTTGWTVRSITLDDGRGGAHTTTFAYAGGRYDRQRKAPLGFRVVTQTDPKIAGESAGPVTEMTFLQEYAGVGQMTAIERRSGAGTLLSREEWSYDMRLVPAYFARPTAHRRYQYDGAGGSVCDGESFAYDEWGNTVAATQEGDCVETSDDATTTVTSYAPNVERFIVSLPSSTELRTVAGELLNETRFFYDDATSHTTPPTSGLPTRVDVRHEGDRWTTAHTVYDAAGDPSETEDALGRVTRFTRDWLGREVEEVNPAGQRTVTAWDPLCGAPATVTDAYGDVTRSTWDVFCRTVRVDEPDGGFVVTRYGPDGDWVETETPAPSGVAVNPTRRVLLDGLGRAYTEHASGPAGVGAITVDRTWDARGNLATVSRPYYMEENPVTPPLVRYGYDALNRPVRVTHPDGAVETTSWGLRVVSRTDEMGHEVADEFDALGRKIATRELTSLPDAGGNPVATWLTTTYRYDPRGALVETVDPLGNVTRYRRDWHGRVTEQDDPDLGTRTYTYDDAGRLVEDVDALGQRTTYAYDALDRPTAKTFGAGSATPVVHTYRYDEAPGCGTPEMGLVDTVRSPSLVERIHRGPGRRVERYTREIAGQAFHFFYTYDAAGNVVRTRFPDGTYDTGSPSAARTFDEAGRLASIPGLVDDIQYDAEGNVVRLAYANGVVTDYTYSPARGWLDRLRTTRGDVVLQDFTYTHDAEGLPIRVDGGPVSAEAHPAPAGLESWTYAYDPLHQLTQAVNLGNAAASEDFVMNAIGNITSTSRLGAFTYNESGETSVLPHAVQSVAGETFAYDANGNMTDWRNGAIAYGPDRMPASVGPNTYAYDAAGLRWRKTTAGGTTRFVTPDYEVAPDGTVTKYVKLDDDDADGFSLVAKMVRKGASAQTWFLHTDDEGSINVVTDAAGQVVLRRTYRPYGDVLWQSSAFAEPRGYTGHYLDGETGLLYMRARYYDPFIGRFVQADEVLDGDGVLALNRFAYVRNSPTALTDPTGRCGVMCLIAVGIVTGIAADLALDAIDAAVTRDEPIGLEAAKDLGYDYVPQTGELLPKRGSGLRKTKLTDEGEAHVPTGGYIKNPGKWLRWQLAHRVKPKLVEEAGHYGEIIYPFHRQAVLNQFRARHQMGLMRQKLRHLRRHRRELSAREELALARRAVANARNADRHAHKRLVNERRQTQGKTRRATARAVKVFIEKARKVPGRQCTRNRKGHRRCA